MSTSEPFSRKYWARSAQFTKAQAIRGLQYSTRLMLRSALHSVSICMMALPSGSTIHEVPLGGVRANRNMPLVRGVRHPESVVFTSAPASNNSSTARMSLAKTAIWEKINMKYAENQSIGASESLVSLTDWLGVITQTVLLAFTRFKLYLSDIILNTPWRKQNLFFNKRKKETTKFWCIIFFTCHGKIRFVLYSSFLSFLQWMNAWAGFNVVWSYGDKLGVCANSVSSCESCRHWRVRQLERVKWHPTQWH